MPQMRTRLLALAPVAAASVAIAGGCGGDSPAGAGDSDATAGPAAYVAAAERLFQPAGEIASAIAARSARPDAGPVDRARLDAIVARAGERLGRLRDLPLAGGELRDQRDRLGAGYAMLIATMGPVVDALAAGEPESELTQAAEPFFATLAELPAATRTAR